MFKEFGVRLNFTPTVIGNDLIHLKVKPEVSALDFANGVVVSGFRVPALSTRRTETEVELQNGQTFAIAGPDEQHADQQHVEDPRHRRHPDPRAAVPQQGAPEEPDRARRHDHADDHPPGSTGVSEGLPSLVEPYLGAPDKTYPNPTPWVGSPRYPANQPAPRTGGTNDARAAGVRPVQRSPRRRRASRRRSLLRRRRPPRPRRSAAVRSRRPRSSRRRNPSRRPSRPRRS